MLYTVLIYNTLIPGAVCSDGPTLLESLQNNTETIQRSDNMNNNAVVTHS